MIAATLLAVTALAAPAPGAPTVSDVRAVSGAARSLWPSSPCAGREQVTLRDLSGRGDGRAGQAHVDGSCQVDVDPEKVHSAEGLCAVLAHEYGHLAGRGHAADPRDVMHDTGTAPPPACTRLPVALRVRDSLRAYFPGSRYSCGREARVMRCSLRDARNVRWAVVATTPSSGATDLEADTPREAS